MKANVNLLRVAKANTKAIDLLSKKENAQLLREAKKLQAEKTKAKKTEKQIEADKIKLSWLTDTQSKTALEKYVKDNSAKFESYLTKVNELNKTNIGINQVNKQLFKFGYFHELNKLDFNGNVIEARSFFNIAFFVVSSNSLLERFAKYGATTNKDFIVKSKKATEQHLDSKFNTFVKNSILKGAKKLDVAKIVKNEAIDRNAKAELIKALIPTI